MPKVDIQRLRQLPDVKDYDPAKEALTMLKPIYGFKDAPRAWRKTFHQVFVQWLSCRRFCIEPVLYCVYKKDLAIEPNIRVRAKEHNEERQESGQTRQIQPLVFLKGNSQCLLSVHVDDIKGAATREIAESLLKHFNVKVGQCKADYNSSLHICIQHEHSAGRVFIHQYVYIDSITPIDPSLPTGKDEEALCDPQLHELYRFWLRRRRLDGANEGRASCLRAGSAKKGTRPTPRIIDCKRLIVVIR